MKTFLVLAAVIGMTSSAAFAECADHVTASAGVDTELTTASIAAPPVEPVEKRSQDVVVTKGSRLPAQSQVKPTE